MIKWWINVPFVAGSPWFEGESFGAALDKAKSVCKDDTFIRVILAKGNSCIENNTLVCDGEIVEVGLKQ